MLLFGWLLAGFVTLIASMLWAIRAGQEPRWGTEQTPVLAGSGAFRSGHTAETRDRRAPILVWIAALAAIAWAFASGWLLAPLAALLSLSALESGGEPRSLPFACMAASALAIAIALGTSGARLLVRAANAPALARAVALASVAHHVALAALCLSEGMRPVLPYAASIAALGIFHELVLFLAGRRVAQLEPA
jgi:hypothetical protein